MDYFLNIGNACSDFKSKKQLRMSYFCKKKNSILLEIENCVLSTQLWRLCSEQLLLLNILVSSFELIPTIENRMKHFAHFKTMHCRIQCSKFTHTHTSFYALFSQSGLVGAVPLRLVKRFHTTLKWLWRHCRCCTVPMPMRPEMNVNLFSRSNEHREKQ